MPESIIKKFGPEAGMPEDVEFLGAEFEGIVVWECPSMNTQHLKPEDIFEELEGMPEYIKKHIQNIILFPFSHPNPNIEAFASACDLAGSILVYSRPESREFIKDRLRGAGTLRHEAGHLIDRIVESEPHKKNFSHGLEWAKAKRLDSAVRKQSPQFPIHWVLGSAEEYSKKYSMEWGLEEDFADSVRFFSGERKFNNLLKINYPHRYKIIKGLLNDG